MIKNKTNFDIKNELFNKIKDQVHFDTEDVNLKQGMNLVKSHHQKKMNEKLYDEQGGWLMEQNTGMVQDNELQGVVYPESGFDGERTKVNQSNPTSLD